MSDKISNLTTLTNLNTNSSKKKQKSQSSSSDYYRKTKSSEKDNKKKQKSISDSSSNSESSESLDNKKKKMTNSSNSESLDNKKKKISNSDKNKKSNKSSSKNSSYINKNKFYKTMKSYETQLFEVSTKNKIEYLSILINLSNYIVTTTHQLNFMTDIFLQELSSQKKSKNISTNVYNYSHLSFYIKFQNYLLKFFLNKKIFSRILKFFTFNKNKFELTDKKFIKKFLNNFDSTGVFSSSSSKEKLIKLNKKIIELQLTFLINIFISSVKIIFSKDELSGLPKEFLQNEKNNSFELEVNENTYNILLQSLINEKTRKKVYTEYNSRTNNTNIQILLEIIILRQKKAEILKYENFSTIEMKKVIMNEPKKFFKDIYTYYDNLFFEEQRALIRAKKDFEEEIYDENIYEKSSKNNKSKQGSILDLKKEKAKMLDQTLHTSFLSKLKATNSINDSGKKKSNNENSNSILNQWDLDFFYNKIYTKITNNYPIHEHFEIDTVMIILLQLIENIFGVRIKKTNKKNILFQKWKKNIIVCVVTEGDNEIGFLYLDLFSDSETFKENFTKTLIPRANFYDKEMNITQKQKPVVCINLNINPVSKKNSEKPKKIFFEKNGINFFKLEQIELLWKNLCKSVHYLVNKNTISLLGSEYIEFDMENLIPNIFVHWLYNKQILSKFPHYESKKPLNSDLIRSIIKLKDLKLGSQYKNTFLHSRFDIIIHEQSKVIHGLQQLYLKKFPEAIEKFQLIYKKSYEEFYLSSRIKSSKYKVPFPQGTFYLGHLTDLVRGKESKLFLDLSCEIFSEDIFYAVFNKNMFDTKNTIKFKKDIMEKGSLYKYSDLLNNFIGRDLQYVNLITNKLTIVRSYLEEDSNISHSTEFIKKNSKINVS